MKKYLIVIDFEANCLENKILYPQEIIEFPAVPICITTGKILHDKIFHNYCNADMKITDFATKLTGITQSTVDNGKSFKKVLNLFIRWCFDNGFTKDNSIIVTCGNWDFKTAFLKQCEYNGLKVPTICKKWCNVKDVYRKLYNVRAGTMIDMLNNMDIKLDGRHHSGIDDTMNISKICLKLLKDGGDFFIC